MKETLDLVNQFGFPLVAAGGLVATILHLRKHHQEKEKAWEEERKRILEAAEKEQKRLVDMVVAGRDARITDYDKLSERIIKGHEISMNIINKTSDIAATLEAERKDIRDAREHEIRALHTTGSNPRERR